MLRAMEADSGIAASELRVDGGAAANDLLMQFQADILQVPVVRPRTLETTALGAAYLAGLAVGYWDGIEGIRSQWQTDRRFDPVMKVEEVNGLRAGWERALERARGWEEADSES